MKYKAVKCRWERFFVVRNINDLITHLPPAVFGFTHVGNLIKIGEKCRYSQMEAHYSKNILKELYNFEAKTIKDIEIVEKAIASVLKCLKGEHK